MSGMIVDGQILTNREVRKLLEMFHKHCQEYAGQFYDQCRSVKFRKAWTEVGLREGRDAQLCFVDAQWSHFVEHVRTVYVGMLTNEKIKEEDKYRIHQALIVQATLGATSQHVPVQIAPNTQQFVGDKFENKQIRADVRRACRADVDCQSFSQSTSPHQALRLLMADDPIEPLTPDPAINPAPAEPSVAADPAPSPAPTPEPPAPTMVPLRVLQERVGEETNRRQAAEQRAEQATARAREFEDDRAATAAAQACRSDQYRSRTGRRTPPSRTDCACSASRRRQRGRCRGRAPTTHAAERE